VSLTSFGGLSRCDLVTCGNEGGNQLERHGQRQRRDDRDRPTDQRRFCRRRVRHQAHQHPTNRAHVGRENFVVFGSAAYGGQQTGYDVTVPSTKKSGAKPLQGGVDERIGHGSDSLPAKGTASGLPASPPAVPVPS